MRWLQGDQFDAVMNYVFTRNALPFFGAFSLRDEWHHEHIIMQPIDAPTLAANIDQMHNFYNWEINFAQLNLLDSHDMPRALHLLGEDRRALQLAVLFQMTMPGAPCIYYGDEIGLSSAGDPYCREAFPWAEQEKWDQDLLKFYQRAAELRNQHPVFRTGSFRQLYAEGMVYAFERELSGQRAVMVFNAGKETAERQIPVKGAIHTLSQVGPYEGTSEYRLENGILNLTVSAQQALVLLTQKG